MVKTIPAECTTDCEDEFCPYTHQDTVVNVIYCVSVYLVDRAYGGPEEGGWYYDCGTPVLECDFPLPRFTTDEDEAYQWRDEMQVALKKHNKGRPSTGSVLSQGVYEARVDEGMPKAFPEVTPHYE